MPFSCVLAFSAILSRSGSKYHLVQFRLLKPSSFVQPQYHVYRSGLQCHPVLSRLQVPSCSVPAFCKSHLVSPGRQYSFSSSSGTQLPSSSSSGTQLPSSSSSGTQLPSSFSTDIQLSSSFSSGTQLPSSFKSRHITAIFVQSGSSSPASLRSVPGTLLFIFQTLGTYTVLFCPCCDTVCPFVFPPYVWSPRFPYLGTHFSTLYSGTSVFIVFTGTSVSVQSSPSFSRTLRHLWLCSAFFISVNPLVFSPSSSSLVHRACFL